ncbi:MAG: hypothetical protein U9Q37_07350 [Euryarchaeota archaeon]|nr:hypothetical protein [Euryarchaeota archaeon]
MTDMSGVSDMDEFSVCFENEVKAMGFGGASSSPHSPDLRTFVSARKPMGCRNIYQHSNQSKQSGQA